MFWTILTAVATIISMFAYLATVLYVRAELKGLEKDRYLTVTNQLFTLWQSKEFMEAQLWIMHRLEETTWEGFVAAHRADTGELAFHQVGAFYDRVGTLIKLGLVDDKEILATMGGFAIAVWNKIGPLVHEARQIENSVLFQDYERMLPSCHECYVPSLKMDAPVAPFSLAQREDRMSIAQLQRQLKMPTPPLLLDVRRPEQITTDDRVLPDAVHIAPDVIQTRWSELPPNRDIVVYCA